ncbi:monocarboxylate transporter 12-like isoform X2 [Mercenaria mercenaria]|uniref:monocarboxylate transporter 12-like isoform X2 n=1 Tax=Mercenaria mercenaria TaxID=6596 RepID=UPI00234F9071|nr:monocarboxylate transporter 12-like isoform X2 [Mercenaria mercenaria]
MGDTIPAEKRKALKDDVDRGFAWVVLIGCFVMYMFVVGSIKAYGMLYTEVVEYYSSGSGNTAWIGSIVIILELGLGLGCGLTFAPCSTIITYYFNKRRALAIGITVSGSGVGAIYLPFLYKYLIEKYGLKGTFWIIGAIFANICVAACIFRQPIYLVEEQKKRVLANNNSNSEYDVDGGQSSLGENGENIAQGINKSRCDALGLRCSLFKNVLFTLYVTSFMCCGFGYGGSLVTIPGNVKALGYDKTYVALSVTISGGAEVLARILIGLFADMNIIKPKYIYAVNMFIGGAFSLIVPFFESFTFIAVYAVIVATFSGSFFSLMPLIMVDAVGLENFVSAFGLLTLSLAVAVLPSQPSVGWLYDLYGNWNPSLILTGCMYILAGIIVLLEPIVVRCCSRRDNEESNSPDNQRQIHNQCTPAEDVCNDNVGFSDTSFAS